MKMQPDDAIAYVISLVVGHLHEGWRVESESVARHGLRADEAELIKLASWVSIGGSSRLSKE